MHCAASAFLGVVLVAATGAWHVRLIISIALRLSPFNLA
jgi:hypothetical protein